MHNISLHSYIITLFTLICHLRFYLLDDFNTAMNDPSNVLGSQIPDPFSLVVVPSLLQSPTPMGRPCKGMSFPLSQYHISHPDQHLLTFWISSFSILTVILWPPRPRPGTSNSNTLSPSLAPFMSRLLFTQLNSIHNNHSHCAHLQIPCPSPVLSCLFGETIMLLKSNSLPTLYRDLGNLSWLEKNMTVLIGLTSNAEAQTRWTLSAHSNHSIPL